MAADAADPAPPPPLDLASFTLIVDDIVNPDGSTAMGQLGGGGPQTLWGFRAVSEALGTPAGAAAAAAAPAAAAAVPAAAAAAPRGGGGRGGPSHRSVVGLAAGVGHDLPPALEQYLEALGCDTSGLLRPAAAAAGSGGRPTPRAWQLFEADGRRTQVWRVEEDDCLYAQLRPAFEALPPALRRARRYHLGIHASHPPMRLLRALREAAAAAEAEAAAAQAQDDGQQEEQEQGQGQVLLSVETYTTCDAPPPRRELSALLTAVDLVSPNLDEARSILGSSSGKGGGSKGGKGGSDDAESLAEALLDAGAARVAVRCGADGALLAVRDGGGSSGMCFRVPAVPDTAVVDACGCGNAFNGGLLAAHAAGLGWREAAAWGSVAGSMMAEWRGMPPADVAGLARVALDKRAALERAMAAAGGGGISGGGGGGGGGASLQGSSSSSSSSSRRRTAARCLPQPLRLQAAAAAGARTRALRVVVKV